MMKQMTFADAEYAGKCRRGACVTQEMAAAKRFAAAERVGK